MTKTSHHDRTVHAGAVFSFGLSLLFIEVFHDVDYFPSPVGATIRAGSP